MPLVQVFKKQNDVVTSLMGAHVQKEGGREFFELNENLKGVAIAYEHNLIWPETPAAPAAAPAQPATPAAPAATK